MNGHMLEQVEYEKDLGIIIDNELKFHVQAVKRAIKYLDKQLRIQARDLGIYS